MNRFQFAWFPRWRKWIALATLLLTLPLLTVAGLEYRKRNLVREILSTGAGLTTEPQARWLSSTFGKVGIDLSQFQVASRYTEIEFLDVTRGGQPLTPREMRQIVQAANRLQGIRKVFLRSPDSPLNAKVIEPLRELDSLSTLNLECGLHDDVLEVVSGIRQLREVHLLRSSDGMLSARGFSSLAMLPRLEKLEVLGGSLTGDDVAALAQSRSLHTLILDASQIEAEGVRELANLPRLERLGLRNSIPEEHFTDGTFEREFIPALAALSALRELRICRNFRVGPPALQFVQLKAALPSVDVTECGGTPADPGRFVPW